MNAEPWHKPPPAVVWQAIEIYLRKAYDGPPHGPGGFPTDVPSGVVARLKTLESTPDEEFYDSNVFERPRDPPRDAGNVGTAAAEAHSSSSSSSSVKLSLRLGNRSYPHMKMVVERSPDGGYLLRADTHDAHIQPRPGSREAAAFAKLMEQNRAAAAAVEDAWEHAGLPTFKKFLRDDLARRKKMNG